MRRIILYLVITFGITYALEFCVIFPLASEAGLGNVPAAATTLAVGSMMFIPAIGVLLTRLITKEGFKNSLIKPVDFRRTFKYYLIAWFGPAVLTIIGASIYFILFPADFDPNMTFMVETLKEQVAAQGGGSLPDTMYPMILWIQILVGLFLAPALNILTCFGEEWGWRGYLLPKVNERLSFIPTVFVTGLIWGLWHAPLTMLGHNYGQDYPGYPFLGILAMCIFCIVIGSLLSFVTIKSKSCLPAAIGHGAINGFAAVGLMFSATGGNPFIGPMPMGVIGGIAFIASAAIVCIIMRKERGSWSQTLDPVDPVPSTSPMPPMYTG